MAHLTCDTREFREEFKKRVLRSKHTLAEVTNEVTFQILRMWQKLIPKANISEIEALGITYRTMNKAGTRKLKRPKPVYEPTSAFKLISLADMWRRGPSPRSFANAAALDENIRRRLARRRSSVGFVASGPVPAMRALLRKIHGGNLEGGTGKRYPGTIGSAKPASEESWNPYAEIENGTGLNSPGQSTASANRVYTMLETTYSRAVDAITEDMARYAEKQIEKAIHGE